MTDRSDPIVTDSRLDGPMISKAKEHNATVSSTEESSATHQNDDAVRTQPIAPLQISGEVIAEVKRGSVEFLFTVFNIQTPCSIAAENDDKSAYWTPSLYYQHSNGSFEEVPNRGMAVYYLGRGDNKTLTPFPPGFRMVSGDKAARSYKKDKLIPGGIRPVSDRVNFACLDGTYSKEPNYMAKTDCKNGLRAQVHFQSCWNGRDLYKPDNSHVEYMSGVDNGDCPDTHP
ncbi:MAG: hypothetical protein Q9180_004233, partial [Flavoplaca navasiana]